MEYGCLGRVWSMGAGIRSIGELSTDVSTQATLALTCLIQDTPSHAGDTHFVVDSHEMYSSTRSL